MLRFNSQNLIRIAIGLGISLGLGWIVIRELDWTHVTDVLSQLSPTGFIAPVSIFLLAGFLRAARWKILFLKNDISLWRLFVVQNEGLGIGNVVPLRLASEIYQVAILTIKDHVSRPNAIAALGMERVVDAVSSATILCVSFFLVPEMQDLKLLTWITFGFAVLAIGLTVAVAWGGQSLTIIHKITLLREISSSIRDLLQHRPRMMLASLMSAAYWILIGTTAWIIAEMIKLPVSPASATLVIIGTTFFATAIPAAPAAIGTFEFAIVYLLGTLGIEEPDAFAYAIVLHTVFFLPATIIAIIFLPKEGITIFNRIWQHNPKPRK